MRQLTIFFAAGCVLMVGCLMITPTVAGYVVLFLLGAVTGVVCTYASVTHSSPPLGVQKSALIGAAVGLLGALLCFVLSAAVLSLSGNSEAVFNLHSLNLSLIGTTQLVLASGVGGLIVGILTKFRQRRASEKN